MPKWFLPLKAPAHGKVAGLFEMACTPIEPMLQMSDSAISLVWLFYLDGVESIVPPS